jgi:transposase
LLRKFIAFEEHEGKAGDYGRELLQYTGILFEYWAGFRDGELSRQELRTWMAPVRRQFEALLQRIVDAQLEEISGSCADMLAHRAALWNFVEHEGVEPTNNHAERELRAFVLWRKRSYGTQSDRGNRFAERVMTIAHTARKQGKNVLELLTACCVAQLDGGACPSLFERPRAAA